MHRILFEIPMPWGGTLPVFSYGFMIMLAFVAAILLAVRRAKARGVNPDVVFDLGLYAIVCGIIGARLAFVMTDPDFVPDPTSTQPFLEYFKIWKGGLTFQGGLFLALAVCLWYMRAHRLPAAVIADIFAPGLALGVALGRIGCFLNGCCWGAICRVGFPLGVRFPEGSGAHAHLYMLHRDGELVPRLSQTGHEAIIEALPRTDFFTAPPAALLDIPLHPTQLYTSLAMIGVFVFVLWLERRPRRFDGMVMLGFLMAYSVVRFLVELIRDDTPLLFSVGGFAGLRLGQILAILTFVIAGGLFVRLWFRNSPPPPPESEETA